MFQKTASRFRLLSLCVCVTVSLSAHVYVCLCVFVCVRQVPVEVGQARHLIGRDIEQLQRFDRADLRRNGLQLYPPIHMDVLSVLTF